MDQENYSWMEPGEALDEEDPTSYIQDESKWPWQRGR